MNRIAIGVTAEGNTDERFLESIIQRTFESVALECLMEIEVVSPIINIAKLPGENFADQILICSKQAYDKGITVFCVHVDSDDVSDSNVLETKLNPAFQFLRNNLNTTHCKNLVSIVPIQMSESWMLADLDLLKNEIGTSKSDIELGVHRSPEHYSDPKEVIKAMIRIARENLPKRRRHELKIAELYQPIGQKVNLGKLERLSSYQKFKSSVREAYKFLNYLH